MSAVFVDVTKIRYEGEVKGDTLAAILEQVRKVCDSFFGEQAYEIRFVDVGEDRLSTGHVLSRVARFTADSL